MKKTFFIVIIILVFLLNACIDPSLDQLNIKLNPSIDTIEINQEYIDQGATATYSFIDVDVIVFSNNLDISTLGTYEIIYKATYKTISKEIIRIVTVVDQSPPELELNPGIDTIFIGETWVDQHVTVTDNSLLVPTVSVTGTVNVNIAGTYIITYTSTDSSGNQSSILRYVEVIDLNTIELN